MSIAPHSDSPAARRRLAELETSAYDKVSGLLLAVLVVFGLIVLMMFVVWLSSRMFWVQPAVQVKVLEDVGGGGSGDGMASSDRQLEEPSPEELKEVTEPPLETTLQSIASVVTTEAAELMALEGATSTGAGSGDGVGDGRGKGPGGPGTSDGIPAWERWELRMSAASLDEYARQLDFFKIELGVAGGGNPNVEYVSQLSTAKPKVRIGLPKDEKRLRFLHRSGELRAADQQLAAKAGVTTTGRVVFQFYDQQTYQQLLALENQKMGSRRIKEVLKTVFGVEGKGGNYRFVVLEQFYTN